MTIQKTEVLPNNADIEKSVLGVFLIESNSFVLFGESLSQDCFHHEKNRIVFQAVEILFKKGHPIDLLTVSQEIEKLYPGKITEMAYYCTTLTRDVIDSAHMDIWSKKLIELKIARKLIEISYSTIGKVNANKDIFEVHDNLQNQLVNLISENIHGQQSDFKSVVREAIIDAEKASNNAGVVGVKTQFDFIDRNVLGLVAPDVTIIAARPGMGKTSFALSLAGNIARGGTPIGFFSFEMKAVQLVNKIFSQYLPEEVNRIRSGKLNPDQWDKLYKGADGLGKLPIHIEDSGSLTVEKIKAITKTWIIKHGIKVLFIDYLQLISPSAETKGGNREAIVSYIARHVKLIAMECNIPIVLLSQLSRESAKDEPELHHLRSSGEIEQSADNVIFLHKNEIETKKYYPNYQDGDREWAVDVLLKKCRLGSIGRRTINFNAAHNKFSDMMNERFASN